MGALCFFLHPQTLQTPQHSPTKRKREPPRCSKRCPCRRRRRRRGCLHLLASAPSRSKRFPLPPSHLCRLSIGLACLLGGFEGLVPGQIFDRLSPLPVVVFFWWIIRDGVLMDRYWCDLNSFFLSSLISVFSFNKLIVLSPSFYCLTSIPAANLQMLLLFCSY